jgi:MBOAT, membrane-bound O-acyltransferase family
VRCDALRLLRRCAALVAALGACVLVFKVHWSRYPFALEHAVKAPLVMTMMICFAQAVAGLWWLAGGRGLDFMGRFPLFAATPAEFWRRWNQPAHAFFELYCARPLGGMRHPVRAILTTFLVSGLGHEYVFSVPAGRLQGYQTAFFLIHGLAVIATLRARPKGWWRLPWWLVTFAFLLVTTVLFGLSVNEILPIYDHRSTGIA